MRAQKAFMKRTELIAVLFYLALCFVPFAASAQAPATASITLINNAALKAGQSLTIKEYLAAGNKDRLVKNLSIGPVETDCTNGCGNEPGHFSAVPGQYRIEVRTDTAASSLTSIRFTVRAGEEYIWMVTNRANPQVSRAVAPGMEMISNTGPFRLDLVTYTPAPKMEAPVEEAPSKKEFGGFWPFKPKARHAAPNN